jgi:hypothetical protein
LAVGVGVLLAAIPLLAHHNITGKFDPARTRTLNGVVTRLDWANPHVHILMDVVEGNSVTNWAVELESTIDLERSGWNLHTLKSGDAVTIQGMLARDGSPQIWGDSVVLTASNKRVLEVSAAAKAACCRWPIYLPCDSALAGRKTAPWFAAGRKRLLGKPAHFLSEAGVKIEANEHGRCATLPTWTRSLLFRGGRELCSNNVSGICCKTTRCF